MISFSQLFVFSSECKFEAHRPARVRNCISTSADVYLRTEFFESFWWNSPLCIVLRYLLL